MRRLATILTATAMAVAPVAASAAPLGSAPTTISMGADARASSTGKHEDQLAGGTAAILGVVLVGGIAAILAVGLSHNGDGTPSPRSP